MLINLVSNFSLKFVLHESYDFFMKIRIWITSIPHIVKLRSVKVPITLRNVFGGTISPASKRMHASINC